MFGILANPVVFALAVVAAFVGIGIGSTHVQYSIFSGFLALSIFGMESSVGFIDSIFYLAIMIASILIGFDVYNLTKEGVRR